MNHRTTLSDLVAAKVKKEHDKKVSRGSSQNELFQGKKGQGQGKAIKSSGEAIEGFADDVFSLPARKPKKILKKVEAQKLIKVLEADLAVEPEKLHETPNPKRREIVKKHVEAFEEKGGKVEELPAGKAFKDKPGMKSAGLGKAKSQKVKSSKPSSAARSGDVVTLQSLMEEYKLSGVAVRKALRGSDIQKPGKQWVWETSQAKEIKEVRKFLESLAK